VKASTRRALHAALHVVLGICAAVPIFLTTSGLPADVGAGATAIAVAATVAKFANLAEDELDK
jgi:hypothetical protein